MLEISYPETPKGKRSVKRNIWGNLVGYVSGKRFWEFGEAFNGGNEATAEAWVKGASLEEAQFAILEK